MQFDMWMYLRTAGLTSLSTHRLDELFGLPQILIAGRQKAIVMPEFEGGWECDYVEQVTLAEISKDCLHGIFCLSKLDSRHGTTHIQDEEDILANWLKVSRSKEVHEVPINYLQMKVKRQQ